VVTLPDWFQALNRDFRYQLTVIGQFAQAVVASKVSQNQFVLRTDKPQVEAVEPEKNAAEKGHYLYPELFGHAGEDAIGDLLRHRESEVSLVFQSVRFY
jgi:hypothetical protein